MIFSVIYFLIFIGYTFGIESKAICVARVLKAFNSNGQQT